MIFLILLSISFDLCLCYSECHSVTIDEFDYKVALDICFPAGGYSYMVKAYGCDKGDDRVNQVRWNEWDNADCSGPRTDTGVLVDDLNDLSFDCDPDNLCPAMALTADYIYIGGSSSMDTLFAVVGNCFQWLPTDLEWGDSDEFLAVGHGFYAQVTQCDESGEAKLQFYEDADCHDKADDNINFGEYYNQDGALKDGDSFSNVGENDIFVDNIEIVCFDFESTSRDSDRDRDQDRDQRKSTKKKHNKDQTINGCSTDDIVSYRNVINRFWHIINDVQTPGNYEFDELKTFMTENTPEDFEFGPYPYTYSSREAFLNGYYSKYTPIPSYVEALRTHGDVDLVPSGGFASCYRGYHNSDSEKAVYTFRLTNYHRDGNGNAKAVSLARVEAGFRKERGDKEWQLAYMELTDGYIFVSFPPSQIKQKDY
jgi:hypothetical protein